MLISLEGTTPGIFFHYVNLGLSKKYDSMERRGGAMTLQMDDNRKYKPSARVLKVWDM